MVIGNENGDTRIAFRLLQRFSHRGGQNHTIAFHFQKHGSGAAHASVVIYQQDQWRARRSAAHAG